MSADAALSPAQFPVHGEGYYQRPLPGLEQTGANKKLPVGHLFKHPQIEQSTAEYHLTMNYHPRIMNVRTSALRPTQPSVDEGYLHSGDGNKVGGVTRQRSESDQYPAAIKDRKGQFRLVDGHHRAARRTLNGVKTGPVRVWDAKEIYG